MAGTLYNEEAFAGPEAVPSVEESAQRHAGPEEPLDDPDVELDDDPDDYEAEREEAARASRRRVARSRPPEPWVGEARSARAPSNRYALAERPVLQVGDIVGGKYRVERVIGRKGSGVMVEGRHVELGQKVAIRHPPREMRARASVVARFLRDARAASQIQSEHAARILDVGRLDSGVPYLVMEGLDGWDFEEVLRVRGPLPVEDAVDYVVQACEAVAEAHGLGLLHRSLGLSNLILTRRPDGSALVKVLDFGVPDVLQAVPFMEIASADAESSAFMSALRFLSPEQVRCADDTDVRADVWALGTVLHELLIGAPAFFGSSPGALLAAVAADPPRATGAVLRAVPQELVAILLRCMTKDRNARFQSVAEFVTALGPYTPSDSIRTVERISRMSVPSRPPPLPMSQHPSSPSMSQHPSFPSMSQSPSSLPLSQSQSSLSPVARLAQSVSPKKPAERSSSKWLMGAGVVGGLIGAALAIGTERLHGARGTQSPVAAAPALEAAAKPVASVVATQQPANQEAAPAPKKSSSISAAGVAAALPRGVPKTPAAVERPATPAAPVAPPAPVAVRPPATAAAKTAPASSAAPKSTVASAAQPGRDLFDDTR